MKNVASEVAANASHTTKNDASASCWRQNCALPHTISASSMLRPNGDRPRMSLARPIRAATHGVIASG